MIRIYRSIGILAGFISFLAIPPIISVESTATDNNGKTITLAITTSDYQNGDAGEKDMWNIVGTMADHVYPARSPDDLIARLAQYQRNGFTISNLVLAGHGEADNPGIQFEGNQILDMGYLHRADQNRAFINKTRNTRPGQIDPAKLAGKQKRFQMFDQASRVMAPNAKVLMINCSPAATKAGKDFVTKLGHLLLSRKGGQILASKNDVTLGQVSTLAGKLWVLVRSGENVPIGEFFGYGDYEPFTIKKAKASELKAAERCTQFKTGNWCANSKDFCVKYETIQSCKRWAGPIDNPHCKTWQNHSRCAEWEWKCIDRRTVHYCDKRL